MESISQPNEIPVNDQDNIESLPLKLKDENPFFDEFYSMLDDSLSESEESSPFLDENMLDEELDLELESISQPNEIPVNDQDNIESLPLKLKDENPFFDEFHSMLDDSLSESEESSPFLDENMLDEELDLELESISQPNEIPVNDQDNIESLPLKLKDENPFFDEFHSMLDDSLSESEESSPFLDETIEKMSINYEEMIEHHSPKSMEQDTLYEDFYAILEESDDQLYSFQDVLDSDVDNLKENPDFNIEDTEHLENISENNINNENNENEVSDQNLESLKIEISNVEDEHVQQNIETLPVIEEDEVSSRHMNTFNEQEALFDTFKEDTGSYNKFLSMLMEVDPEEEKMATFMDQSSASKETNDSLEETLYSTFKKKLPDHEEFSLTLKEAFSDIKSSSKRKEELDKDMSSDLNKVCSLLKKYASTIEEKDSIENESNSDVPTISSPKDSIENKSNSDVPTISSPKDSIENESNSDVPTISSPKKKKRSKSKSLSKPYKKALFKQSEINECKENEINECKENEIDECKQNEINECKENEIDECKQNEIDECKENEIDECKENEIEECIDDGIQKEFVSHKKQKFFDDCTEKKPSIIVKLPVLLAKLNIDVNIVENIEMFLPIKHVSQVTWSLKSIDCHVILPSTTVFLKGVLVADIEFANSGKTNTIHSIKISVPWTKNTTVDWLTLPDIGRSSQKEFMFQSQHAIETSFHHEFQQEFTEPIRKQIRKIDFVWHHDIDAHSDELKFLINGTANLCVDLYQEQCLNLNEII